MKVLAAWGLAPKVSQGLFLVLKTMADPLTNHSGSLVLLLFREEFAAAAVHHSVTPPSRTRRAAEHNHHVVVAPSTSRLPS